MRKVIHTATLSAAVYTGLILLSMLAGYLPVNMYSILASVAGLAIAVPMSCMAVCVRLE